MQSASAPQQTGHLRRGLVRTAATHNRTTHHKRRLHGSLQIARCFVRLVQNYDGRILLGQRFEELLTSVALVDLRVGDEDGVIARALQPFLGDGLHFSALCAGTRSAMHRTPLHIDNGCLKWVAQNERFDLRANVQQVAVHVREQLRVFGEEDGHLVVENGVADDGRSLATFAYPGLVP